MAYDPFGNQSYAQNQSIGQPMTASERARRFLRNNRTWQSWTGQNVASTPATQTYAQRATPALAQSFYSPSTVAGGDNQSLEVYGPARPNSGRSSIYPSFSPPAKSQAISTSGAKPETLFTNELPTAQQIADQRGLTGIARQRFIEAASGIAAKPAKLDATFSTQAFPTETATQEVSPLQSQYDSAQKQYDEARQRFLGLLDNQDVANLEKQLADYQAATQTAVTGEEGQGRGKTASLVRGRQALLEQQRGIEEQNLLSQLDITRNLINQKQSAAYQAMGFAKEDLDNIREQVLKQGEANFGEIKEFGDQLLRIAPDGTVSVLAQRSPEAMKPITVSAGQTVIDPNTGEVLFQAGEKPEALPSSIQEYMFAAQQGYTGTYNDFKSGTSSATAGKPSQLSLQALSLVDQLISHPGREAATGTNRLFAMIPGSSGADFKAQLERLKSLLSLDNIQYLKGTGAMSDREFATLSSAAAALDPNMSEGAFLRELERIKSSLGVSATGVQPPTDPQHQMYYNLMQGGQITPEEYQELTGSFTNDLSTSQNGSIGELSSKYESGGNPGAIGYDSTGGYSYGTYQLAHNNAKNFVAQSPYAQYFQGLTFNSPQWQQRWKQIAQQDPEGFGAAQKQYIAKTHLEPQVQKLSSAGITFNSLPSVIQDVIWSTAVQHGGNTNIIVNALKASQGASPQDIIKKIYELRWNGGQNFASSTPQVRQSVYNRFFGPQGEMQMALNSLNNRA